MIELSDKDFKTVIINTFKGIKETIYSYNWEKISIEK
jgi:hypothetical protein